MSTRQREKAEERRNKRAAMGPQATLRHLRMSPRKVRLVVDLIRGAHVEDALNLLTFSRKAAALPVAKLLRSVLANAEEKGGFDVDRLFIESAFVNEGVTNRRYQPRAHGRAFRIRKRASHITLVLGEK